MIRSEVDENLKIDVFWLEHLLAERRAWVTCDEINRIAADDRPADEARRWVRRLAAQSRVIISGQQGYRHLDGATLDEVLHFSAALESQARAMRKRARSITRAAFGRELFGEANPS